MEQRRLARVLGVAIAALLVAAAMWFALYDLGLSAPERPGYAESRPRAANVEAFLAHAREHGWQEVAYTLLAAAAFGLLAPFGALLRRLAGGNRVELAAASALFALSAALLVAGQVVQLGTMREVLALDENPANDPETLSIVWDAGLSVSNWLENGGYAALTLGVAGFGVWVRPRTPTWTAVSLAVALALATVATSQALAAWAVYDLALLVAGVLLGPLWFLLAARAVAAGGRESEPPRGN